MTGASISMDGKGKCLDNIFVERLWRSVKYENVYLYGYSDIPEAREGLRNYFAFYNYQRFHQSLDNRTPWQVYTQNRGVSQYGCGPLIGLTGDPRAIFFGQESSKPQSAAFAQ